jgi:hypothetical protein
MVLHSAEQEGVAEVALQGMSQRRTPWLQLQVIVVNVPKGVWERTDKVGK